MCSHLRLIADVELLLPHAEHGHLVPGPANDTGKDGAGSILTREPGLHHACEGNDGASLRTRGDLNLRRNLPKVPTDLCHCHRRHCGTGNIMWCQRGELARSWHAFYSPLVILGCHCESGTNECRCMIRLRRRGEEARVGGDQEAAPSDSGSRKWPLSSTLYV